MTPFARISTRVFDHMADLGPSGLAVYAGLAKYADNLTRACFPRQGTLAKLLHLPRQSVNTAILRLESLGLIEVERRAGRGHVYRLLDAEPATVGFAPRPCGANAEQSAVVPLPEPVERPPLSAPPTGVVRPADNINYIHLTRLKKTQQHPPAPAEDAPDVVVVPLCLQNLDVAPILAPVPPPHRQTLLDTYAARHQWGRLNGSPVALPLAMLRALVKQCLAGTLDTAQAHKIAAQREVKRPVMPPPRPLAAPSSRDAALAALRGARMALGGRAAMAR